jgi:hypothetical protein
MAERTKKMKPGTYNLACWQHNKKPLMFTAWSDNSIVKQAGDIADRQHRESDEKEQRWEEVEDFDVGTVSCANEILLHDISPHQ